MELRVSVVDKRHKQSQQHDYESQRQDCQLCHYDLVFVTKYVVCKCMMIDHLLWNVLSITLS